MPPKRRRIKKRKNRKHIVLILLLVIVGVFFMFGEFEKEKAPKDSFDTVKPPELPKFIKPEPPRQPVPEKSLPVVAIVMDDLGQSKSKAQQVFDLNVPITLSILPQQRYSKWLAEEGHKRGYDIIVHLPMEATRALKLGKGGLYRRMSDTEIRNTTRKNILSVPHAMGASNHMGSALTKDRKAMNTVMSEIKNHRLFFLDSLTTPDSVAFDAAEKKGLKTLRRDVFLDNADDLKQIEIQWNRLLKIAEKSGKAIALGHPKKKTLYFLQKALKKNDRVTVVPISELLQ